MAYGILVPSKIAATNVDSYNRNFVSTTAIQNGAVIQPNGLDKGEVFKAVTPTALTDLYIVYNPEVVNLTVNGKSFRGIDDDPRDFINEAGKPFNAFKPKKGDLIQLSADCFASAHVTGTDFAITTVGSTQLSWGSAAVQGLTLKYVADLPIKVANGGIGGENVTAYLMEVVAE